MNDIRFSETSEADRAAVKTFLVSLVNHYPSALVAAKRILQGRKQKERLPPG